MSKKYIGNLVQSLSGGSGGGGGGDTGVGKPYPGSTGGEYFNYYGDDSNKNIASGDYSTARGRKVTAEKENTFSSGYNIKNDVTNGIAIGRNISLRGFNDGVHSCGIAIGRNISVVGGSSYSTNDGVIAIGDRIFGTSDIDAIPSIGEGPYKGIYIGSAFEKDTQNAYYAVGAMIGKGLKLKSKYGDTDNTNGEAFIVGQYNDTNLPDALFAIGCGTNRNNRKNALSVSNTKFKVLNDLQLATDDTSANAITAPQDSSNVTTDDQTLATKSYVDANSGSGGVGQAYSGSTGGEIFNYYGTDSNANEASGDYSTTIGYNNKNAGTCSFCGGKNNYLDTNYTPSFIFGDNNGTSGQRYGNCIVLGHNNKGSGQGAQFYIMGKDNTINYPGGIVIANKASAYGGYYFGEGVKAISTQNILQCVIGLYNAGTTLPNPRFAIGVGTSSERITALEMNKTVCKINNKLQLASDGTEVNAITPPQDPNNVTADDKTLATKSYVSGVLPPTAVQSTVGYFETSLSTSVYPNTDGTPLTLASFTTIPSWANHALVYFHWEGETHFKDIILDRDSGLHLDIWQTSTSGTPLQIRHAHYRLEYTSLDKAITATDYWEYTQDATNNTISGTITGLSNVTYNARILSVVYTA